MRFLIFVLLSSSQALVLTNFVQRFRMWIAGESGKPDMTPPVTQPLELNVTDSSVSFMAVGDWGQSGPKFDYTQAAFAKQYESLKESNSKPSFMVLLGDNFYPDGIKSPSDKKWDEHWYGGMLKGIPDQIPWYVILGNHDHMGNRGQFQVNFHYSSRNDGRWQLPDYFYSQLTRFEGGSLCNVFMDVMKLNHRQQLSWLQATLASKDCQAASWILVYNHFPLVSAGKNRGSKEERRLVQDVLPLLQKYGVDLFLSGHDHDLQHLKYKGGPHVVVSGAGSEPRHSGGARIPERIAYLQEVVGFTKVEASSDYISIEFFANEWKKSDPKTKIRPEMSFTLTAKDRTRKV